MRKKFLAALGLTMIIFLMVALVACNDTKTETYTISFSGTDSAINSISVKAGEVPSIPSVPEKTGYSGVWTLDGNTFNSEKVFDYGKNIELVAQYTLLTYNVVFKADGVQVGDTHTYTVENKIVTEPTVPAKVGYTGAWETYELTTGNVTVNAVYTAIAYTVKFVADGTQVGDTQTYTVENKNITVPTVPTKVGYTGAWEAYTLTTGDITVNAVYTINHYTVKFVADGVQVGETQTYTVENKNITVPSVPTKAGYTGAWEGYELTLVDIIINAVYTANTDTEYTVEHYFENIDGEYILDSSRTQLLSGTTDTTVNAVALNIEHYSENKDYSDRIASGNINGDGSLVLKLYYALDRVQVTFDFGTTQDNTIVDVRYGAKVAKEDAIVDAKYLYALVEWQKDGVTYDFENAVVESITLNAVFANESIFDDFETENEKWKLTTASSLEYVTSAVISGTKSMTFTTTSSYNGIYRQELNEIVDFTDVNYIYFKVRVSTNAKIMLRFFNKNNFTDANYLQLGQDVKADGAWHLVCVDMSALSSVGTAFDKTEVKSILIMSSVASSVEIDDVSFVRDNSLIAGVKACYDFEDQNGWKSTGSSTTMNYVTDDALSGDQSIQITTTAWNGLYNQNINGTEFAEVKYIYLKVKTTVATTLSMRLYSGTGIGNNYVSVTGTSVAADGEYHIVRFDVSNWSGLTATGTAFDKNGTKTMLIRTSVATTLTIDDVIFSTSELNIQ